MGTAEWIALGLLLIALVGWRRWRGTPEGSRLSSFATDRRTSEAISMRKSWKPSE
jgi:hypothetical protein